MSDGDALVASLAKGIKLLVTSDRLHLEMLVLSALFGGYTISSRNRFCDLRKRR